jgi:hypothetical protein
MPRQNRVTPFGEIVQSPARGTLMGNRGCIHDAQGRLATRRWARPAWITCALEFRGRRRQVMSPGSYTELFFLDEVTSFAAGHRPCARCRGDRYREFISLWFKANQSKLDAEPRSTKILDSYLHRERVDGGGNHVRWRSAVDRLPDGAVVSNGQDEPLLLWRGRARRWTHDGYSGESRLDPETQVSVLTPESVCETFRLGYVPEVHPSALIRDP